MTLSINVSGVNNAKDCENLSPGSKRKSDLISPSCNNKQSTRSPLADINKTEVPAKAHSTPSKASKSYATYSSSNSNRQQPKWVKNNINTEEIVATDDKQASVGQLSSWLSESAKKNKARKPPIHHTNISAPIRFTTKPRIKQEDVQATDDKQTSVKTLSSWMNDDPFQQKKVRVIRSGAKVIAKSRMFEKDQNITASKECNIQAGSVSQRQAWLNNAFQHDKEENNKIGSLSDKKIRPYQQQQSKPKKESPEKELKSVKEKKEWLSKAFGNSKTVDSPVVNETKSFDIKHDEDEIPDILHTKSFEVFTPTKASSTISDKDGHRAIHNTKSYDDGMINSKPTTNTFERQQSVVRLYDKDEKDGDDDSPEKMLKSVHDKQAWLSGAFKKPAMKQSTVIGDESEKPDVDKMTVAERKQWLQGAFK